MKILSKYKDYYDYLSGVWGEDPKLILDRREFDTISLVENTVYHIYIGNFKIEAFCKDGVLHYGDKLKEFEKEEPYSKYYTKPISYKTHVRILVRDWTDNRGRVRYDTKWVNTVVVEGTGKVTVKENCPIIVKQESANGSSIVHSFKYAKLEDLGLAKFVDATDTYRMISEWLANRVDEMELTTSMTDAQKIENKGFDKKTSFRPNMK